MVDKNKLIKRSILLLLVTVIFSLPASAFAGGDGSVGDPYQISTVEQLQKMNSGLSANYILINDIDASVTSGWNSGAGFDPIGDFSNPFTGTFDGDCFVITGLYVNRPSTHEIGLFGYLGPAAVIRNVGLEDVAITGNEFVGGLVGMSDGSISQSYSTGTVTGSSVVGGFVGEIYAGSISQSYSTCAVYGTSNVGGFAGDMWGGSIDNSYSTGSVTGTSDVGGFVGLVDSGSITNSYWNTETSGQATSAGGTGKTTAQMKEESTYFGWDFASVWVIDGTINSGYPYLQIFSEPVSLFAGGDGSAEDPYQISTVEQLQNMSTDLSANYILINNIDASATSGWDGGFEPIGYWRDMDYSPFAGTFDGQDYVITGLYINKPSTYCVGLFGYINETAQIVNVGLENINVTGSYEVGGLAGGSSGLIQQSYSTGNVTANTNAVGGLVGYNMGSVNESYSAAEVTAVTDYVGGLVGYNSGSINQSYSNGKVSGTDYVGGLVGYNEGSVNQSYSTGEVLVTGDNIGGLAGENVDSITNSYWDTQTSSQATSAGGTGKTTAQMKEESTYINWDFTSIWSTCDSVASS